MASEVDPYVEIAKVNGEIRAVMDDPEYLGIRSKHCLWGKLKEGTVDEHVITRWDYFQSKLEELNKQRDIWVQFSLSRSEAKKADTVRKGYKKSAAVKSERQLLTIFADYLRKQYVFEQAYRHLVTFGDVMNAVGFYSDQSIHQYFETLQNPNRKYQPIQNGAMPMEQFFEQDMWLYLVKLHRRVNDELHPLRANEEGLFTVVLENIDPNTVGEILGRCGLTWWASRCSQ